MQCTTCQNIVSYVNKRLSCHRLLSLLEIQESASKACCQRCIVISEAVQKWAAGGGEVHRIESPELYVVGIDECGWSKMSQDRPVALSILVSLRKSWTKRSGDDLWELCDPGNEMWFQLHTESGERSFRSYPCLRCVVLRSDESSEALDIPRLSPVVFKPTLNDYAVQARTWLDDCLRHHSDSCPPARQALPTRIIDVGDMHRDPKVYESLPSQEDTYFALSYCWGNDYTLTTTLSTLKDRKQGFNLDKLPRTIRDAVLLTRALNVKYLWVDSLCIIQDSPEDWAQEAARMNYVYTKAALTFVAVDSPGSNTGLFLAGGGRRLVGLEWGGGGKVFARTHPHTPGLRATQREEHVWNKGVLGQSCVLHTRGWCVQELALSARILWMKAEEISWTCVNSKACECLPEPAEHMFNRLRAAQLPSGLESMVLGIQTFENQKLGCSEWMYLWMDLVAEYTTRCFTHETDRLPAISGIAMRFKSNTRAQYLYGLWKTQGFLEQLLWRCPQVDVPLPYDAARWAQLSASVPSWSWAGCNGQITLRQYSPQHDSETLEEKDYNRLWTLESISFTLSTLNPYGPGSGTLKIHTLMVPISFQAYRCTKQDRGRFVYAGPTPYTDTPLALIEDTSTDWYEDQRSHPLHSRFLHDSQKPRLYFMFAETSWWASTSKDGPSVRFQGLVVEELPADDSNDSQIRYRRLGAAIDEFCLPNQRQTSREDDDVEWGSHVCQQRVVYDEDNPSLQGSWQLWESLGIWRSIQLI